MSDTWAQVFTLYAKFLVFTNFLPGLALDAAGEVDDALIARFRLIAFESEYARLSHADEEELGATTTRLARGL